MDYKPRLEDNSDMKITGKLHDERDGFNTWPTARCEGNRTLIRDHAQLVISMQPRMRCDEPEDTSESCLLSFTSPMGGRNCASTEIVVATWHVPEYPHLTISL